MHLQWFMVSCTAGRGGRCGSGVIPRPVNRWLQRLAFAVVTMLGLCLASAVHSFGAPVEPSADIAVEAQMLVDPAGELDLDAVIRRFEAGEGQPSRQQQVRPLEGSQAVWYRLVLPPAVPSAPQFCCCHTPGWTLLTSTPPIYCLVS